MRTLVSDRWEWRRIAYSGAVVCVALACHPTSSAEQDEHGDDGAMATESLMNTGGMANIGGFTNTGGDGDPSLHIPGPEIQPEPLDPDRACGIGTAEATLKPVNVLVMFDRSTSMTDNVTDPASETSRWEMATSALKNFLSHPSTDGLGVALRFFPHDLPAAGCSSQSCNVSACAQPLVELKSLEGEAGPADAHEWALFEAIDAATPSSLMNQGTPTGAALEGAVEWAVNHQVERADERTAILIVTDGAPEGCEERIFSLLQHLTRAVDVGIKTYFIGITDSAGEGLRRAEMDYLANAGGTDQAYYITDGPAAAEDLLETFDAIRGATLECDFPVPQATVAGDVVDPALVNVTYLPTGQAEESFTKVTRVEDCGDSHSWFYDDEDHPERLRLCPAACELVSAASEAHFRILVGCVSELK